MTDLTPLSQQIWDMKYRQKSQTGEVIDKTISDSWHRVASALAEAEPNHKKKWAGLFYDALSDFNFLPAGRILAGAGTGRRVTLFNCFVMGTIPDDLGGIFDHLREAAITMQQGGGIGYDFSPLRPKGAPVKGVCADASGPLSFMDVWDSMCRTIMSAGSRRGAMMATLRCDHPDIEAFIDAKQEPNRLRMFNLSVLVTDNFMDAVHHNLSWTLQFEGRPYRSLPARELWDKIMKATYDYAEPGVIFIDRINRRNNLWYVEDINATNPCGEQPLPPYGTCLLGSINLARLIDHPFEKNASLDEKKLEKLVRLAVRMLDNVIDVSNYPLEQQKQEAFSKRRIGLGITGLADALILCRARYGGPDALCLTEQWMSLIRRYAYLESTVLASEKGAFPLFNAQDYLAGDLIKTLDKDVQDAIRTHGIRNALLTSIAPTGTISLLADNVSSGLEPVFSFTYHRRILMPDGTRKEEEVSDYAYRLYRKIYGTEVDLPDYFIDAQSLSPSDHLKMQALVQRYVDSSISKTVNVPETISFEDFKTIYHQAYDSGCKGCTTYRPNDITGSILSVQPTEKPSPLSSPEPIISEQTSVIHLTQPLNRPEELPGATYKVRWPESDHAMYITINDIIQDGRRRPFEVFINSKNMDNFAWTVALTRMISAVFRRGGDISFVVEELKAVFDPRGGQWMSGRYVPSLLAAIGDVIEKHLISIGFIHPKAQNQFLQDKDMSKDSSTAGHSKSCSHCGHPTLYRQEGCDLCTNCGYSKCA